MVAWVIVLAPVNLAAGDGQLALERSAESGGAPLILAVAVDVLAVDHHVQLIEAPSEVGRDLDLPRVGERAVLARRREAVEREDRVGARVSTRREGHEDRAVVVEALG